MIQPQNETEDSSLSITKNCETLIEQTHRKPEETLEFKKIKSRETIHFKPPIRNKGDWMIGLVDLEVYISIFSITEGNNKFELHKFPDEMIDGVSYIKVTDEIEKDFDISDITAADLQDDIIGSIIIEEYREQVAKRTKDGEYMNILSIYTSSIFPDFESFLRTQMHLIEEDFILLLHENNSSFITYELQPGEYRFKDISEALFNILQFEYPVPSNVIDIELSDFYKRTKLVVRPGITAIRFDEKMFLRSVLGFTPGWDYKLYNEYTCQKIVNLNNTNKIHLKCDVIDGSVVNVLRQPILF